MMKTRAGSLTITRKNHTIHNNLRMNPDKFLNKVARILHAVVTGGLRYQYEPSRSLIPQEYRGKCLRGYEREYRKILRTQREDISLLQWIGDGFCELRDSEINPYINCIAGIYRKRGGINENAILQLRYIMQRKRSSISTPLSMGQSLIGVRTQGGTKKVRQFLHYQDLPTDIILYEIFYFYEQVFKFGKFRDEEFDTKSPPDTLFTASIQDDGIYITNQVLEYEANNFYYNWNKKKDHLNKKYRELNTVDTTNRIYELDAEKWELQRQQKRIRDYFYGFNLHSIDEDWDLKLHNPDTITRKERIYIYKRLIFS